MVSIPEVFTDDSTIYPMTPTPVKKPSARKSLCIFTNILDMRKKNSARRVGATKYKRKTIKYGTTPWELKKTENGVQNQ